jgi:BMFP domain-containing protein YqiC
MPPLTDAHVFELTKRGSDFYTESVMLFSAMRDRLALLEGRIKQLEEQQSHSTATAKLKLVHDGSS